MAGKRLRFQIPKNVIQINRSATRESRGEITDRSHFSCVGSKKRKEEMKKIALVFAMLLAAAAVVEAKTKTSLAIIARSSSKYEIIYSTTEEATLKIVVADSYGNRLSSRVVHNVRNFKMPVVLKDAGPGRYYVIVDNGKEVVKKELPAVQPRPIYSHVANLGDDRYLVSISNTGTLQPIKISVYDGLSNLLQSLNEVVDGQKAVIVRIQNANGRPTFDVSDPSGLSEVIHN
jgi:hypothetical protein